MPWGKYLSFSELCVLWKAYGRWLGYALSFTPVTPAPSVQCVSAHHEVWTQLEDCDLHPVTIQGCRIIWKAHLCTQMITPQILCVWQTHKPASTIHSWGRKPIGSQMSFTPGILMCSETRVWKPISEKPLNSAMAWLQIGKGQEKFIWPNTRNAMKAKRHIWILYLVTCSRCTRLWVFGCCVTVPQAWMRSIQCWSFFLHSLTWSPPLISWAQSGVHNYVRSFPMNNVEANISVPHTHANELNNLEGTRVRAMREHVYLRSTKS